jgi:hypothetical protein
VSFAGEVADLWAQVEKPIWAYYLGDYDPSGFDLERDLREKLERYSGRPCNHGPYVEGTELVDGRLFDPGAGFLWIRLGLRYSDFEEHGLIELPVKRTDKRSKAFVREHGDACAELDALPPNELRQRVRDAIERHIDPARWERLQEVERLERDTLATVIRAWGPEKTDLASLSEDDDR